MAEKIIFAGFGGQGVLFAGKLMALAGMESGRHVTWLPAYGPEMRGGTANCSVIIADKKIGSPIIEKPTVLVALNRPSLEKFAPKAVPGGLIICDAADRDGCGRKDVELLPLSFAEIGQTLGTNGLINIVTLGALLARRPILTPASVGEALQDGKVPEARAKKNVEALELGCRLAASAPQEPQ